VQATGIPEEIRNEKLLIVEGKDDAKFFVNLLKKLSIEGVYVTALESKSNFNDDIPDLKKRPGFQYVTHLGVIRDKDTDDAFESVKNILIRKMDFQDLPQKNGQFATGTPKIGIFIMPGDSIAGTMLEDLCLKTVENKPAMQCVNDFAMCLDTLDEKPHNLSKSKVQAYLAAQPEIANSAGSGAEKGYWDFNSPELDELRTFLINFR